jgi:DNA polymerase-3 subunit alpha
LATPIHNHSHYSFAPGRDGLSSTAQIADRVAQLGYDACALTDHDVVAGHIEFYNTMTDAGLKPILGIEAYQARETRFEHATKQSETIDDVKRRIDNYHLIILAKNDVGLRNLWALNTQSHQEGFWFHGRVDWELLRKYRDGLILTSACGLSMLNHAIQHGDPELVIQQYQDIFGDDFFIELHTYPEDWQKELNVALVSLAQQFSVPLVYANDAHYAFPEQYDLHETIIALAMNSKVDSGDRISHVPGLHIMAEEETREYLDYLPKRVVDEAVKNSDLIASMVDAHIPGRSKRIPMFVPGDRWATSKEMIYDLAVVGYMKKIAPDPEKDDAVYMERFEKEMQVLFDADLVDYFAITRDFVKFAKDEGALVGPGRGSAGGSLIAYLLGITELDPIRFGLIFERFYNAGRETGLPDIDIDFPTTFRDKVKSYLSEKYGPAFVAELATIGRLHGKGAIADMARVLGVPMNDSKAISKILDQTIKQGLQAGDWDEIYELVGEALKPYREKYPDLFLKAEELHGFPKTFGVHASGVLVSDEPLAETFPLKWSASKKTMVTQFDMEVAADLGFMKLDLLGLRNLDTLTEFNRILEEEDREPIDFYSLQYTEQPEEMWELLDQNLTVGIFQIESGGLAKQIARELKPRSIEELAVVVAMNRPGPLLAGAFDKYKAGKAGASVEYLHPYLEDTLRDTFGVFLYQEQVIEFMTKIGYNLFEADDVRSIMGKKKIEKITAELDRYLPRALNHMPEHVAMDIWNELVNFSRYGFNKSHAVAYAMVGLWTLYAKWYDPVIFTLAGIRTVDKDDLPRYVQEAQRMSIKVLPPQINDSDVQITKRGDAIIYGFNNVKGIGLPPARWFVAHQPYDDVEDLLIKAQTFKQTLPNGQQRVVVNAGQIENLIRLGAFGECSYNKKIKKDVYKRIEPEQGTDKLDLEEELLGVALSDDSATILEEHAEIIDEMCVPLDSMTEPGEYTVAGIIRGIRESKTKNGDKMAYLTLEIEGQEVECAVWSNILKRLDFIFRRRQAGIFLLKKDKQGRLALSNAKALFRSTSQTNDKYQTARSA